MNVIIKHWAELPHPFTVMFVYSTKLRITSCYDSAQYKIPHVICRTCTSLYCYDRAQ